MKTATPVRDVSEKFRGETLCFKVEPQMRYNYLETDEYGNVVEIEEETEYVVVSSTIAPFSDPETFIFPSDKDGNVVNWLELDGSYRGELNIEKALQNAGYTVVK